MIVKRKGKFILYSLKKPRKKLGTFGTIEEAKKREKQIQYFKWLAKQKKK